MNFSPIVIKLGGAAGNESDGLLDDVAALHAEGRPVVLIHGGSAETDALSTALGHPPQTILSPSGHSSRNTDRRTVETFAQATALVNRRLVEAARGRGIDAFGLSGLDGGLVVARRKEHVRAVVDGRTTIVRDQWTGRIRSARGDLLRTLLSFCLVPVVAPLACGENGEMLNVDGDRLAAAVATALEAEHLLLLTNVEGLRRTADVPESLMRVVEFDDLDVAEKAAAGRMKRKVLGAREALEGGVTRVVIASTAGEAPVRAALAGGGTHFLRSAAVERTA